MAAEARTRVGDSAFASYASIFAVALAGNGFIALSPLYLGAMVDHWAYSESALGAVISYGFFGTAATTILGYFILHRPGWPFRTTAFGALAVFGLANLLTPIVHEHYWLLAAVRFVSGLGAGLTWVTSAAALMVFRANHRAVSLFYGMPFVQGVIFQPLMPTIIATWGVEGAFAMLAIGAALPFLFYPFFPARNPETPAAAEATSTGVKQRALLWLLVGSLVLQYIANSGLWTYFERIGVGAGHSAQTTANVLSIAVGMAFAGSIAASTLGNRIKPVAAIVWGTVIAAFASALVFFARSLPIFVVSGSLFNMVITFSTPFYFALLPKVCTPAKSAVIGNIGMIIGFSLGPVVIGTTVTNTDFTLAVTATITLFLFSLLVILAFAVLSGRSPGSPAPSAAFPDCADDHLGCSREASPQ